MTIEASAQSDAENEFFRQGKMHHVVHIRMHTVEVYARRWYTVCLPIDYRYVRCGSVFAWKLLLKLD